MTTINYHPKYISNLDDYVYDIPPLEYNRMDITQQERVEKRMNSLAPRVKEFFCVSKTFQPLSFPLDACIAEDDAIFLAAVNSTFAAATHKRPQAIAQEQASPKDHALQQLWAHLPTEVQKPELQEPGEIRIWLEANKAALATVVLLNLSNCDLKVVPEELKYFTNLTHLYLEHNRIETFTPGVFTELQALSRLHLHYNKIQTLPSDIFTLPKLRRLSLGNNQIETISQEAFAGLQTLAGLGLDNNRLKRLPPGVFTGLTKLHTLNLNCNPLEALPPELFKDLTRLETISLRGTTLSGDVTWALAQALPEVVILDD
ncbi:MAG: leucine-rich repeat domain-containing protein [Chlamydiae bacterium]|nr:leucine-rich repeat domain-containing protein [Chlamydiota bacterium]